MDFRASGWRWRWSAGQGDQEVLSGIDEVGVPEIVGADNGLHGDTIVPSDHCQVLTWFDHMIDRLAGIGLSGDGKTSQQEGDKDENGE
jgi:hypothetical protein